VQATGRRPGAFDKIASDPLILHLALEEFRGPAANATQALRENPTRTVVGTEVGLCRELKGLHQA